jgi:hypothetical protein
MAFQPNIAIQQRFLAFIYGKAGHGKTSAYFSLLKNPKLRLVVYALDPTTDFAMQNAFNIFSIEDLLENQLIYVKPEVAKLGTESSTLSCTDSTFLNSIVKNIHNAIGIDAKTGKQVALKGIDNTAIFDENTVIVFDGFSAFVETCEAKAKAACTNNQGVVDTRAAFGVLKSLVQGITSKLILNSKCHVIVCGHEQLADEVAVQKYKAINMVNPFVGVRSLIDPLCGKFTFVLYAKRDSMTNKFVLSVAENGTYVRDRIDRAKFAVYTTEYNKDKKPNEKIDLSNLPQDLTHECFDFLK